MIDIANQIFVFVSLLFASKNFHVNLQCARMPNLLINSKLNTIVNVIIRKLHFDRQKDRQKYRIFVKAFDETWPRDQKYKYMTSNYSTDQQQLRNVSALSFDVVSIWNQNKNYLKRGSNKFESFVYLWKMRHLLPSSAVHELHRLSVVIFICQSIQFQTGDRMSI